MRKCSDGISTCRTSVLSVGIALPAARLPVSAAGSAATALTAPRMFDNFATAYEDAALACSAIWLQYRAVSCPPCRASTNGILRPRSDGKRHPRLESRHRATHRRLTALVRERPSLTLVDGARRSCSWSVVFGPDGKRVPDRRLGWDGGDLGDGERLLSHAPLVTFMTTTMNGGWWARVVRTEDPQSAPPRPSRSSLGAASEQPRSIHTDQRIGLADDEHDDGDPDEPDCGPQVRYQAQRPREAISVAARVGMTRSLAARTPRPHGPGVRT